MTTKTKKQQIKLNITGAEIRNIVNSYEIDTIYADDDVTYAIKKAMNTLDASDKIIYCLYLELGTKTQVAEVLGISRISATRIIKSIEEHIKKLLNENNDRPITDNTDTGVHN